MKFLNWLSSTIWWLSVACVLISALAIAAVRLSLEYLAEDSERLSKHLQKLTTQPVTFGHVDLDWRGAIPVISIDQVSYDGDDVVVNLGTVELQPLLFESVLQLKAQFGLASVETGTIDIFLDQFQGEASSVERIIAVLTTIIQSGNYLLADVTLRLHKGGGSQAIYIKDARSLYSEGQWIFELKSEIPDFFSQLDIVVDHTGSALESSEDLDGRVYVSFDVSPNMKNASTAVLPAALELSGGKAEVWLDFINGVPQGIQASIADSSISYANQKFQSVTTDLIAQRTSAIPDALPQSLEDYFGMWSLYIPQLAFQLGTKKHQFDSLFFSQLNAGKTICFSAETLHTDIVMPLIIGMFPEQRAVLSQWPVSSIVHNLYGYVPLTDPSKVVAKAQLEKVTVGSANNNILQVESTGADLIVSDQRALINIDPSQVASLRINSIYDHRLRFTHPAAQIAINWSDLEEISFSADNMFVHLKTMTASVDWEYKLDVLEPHLSSLLLQVTGHNVPASFKDILVPYQLLSNQLTRQIRDSLTGTGRFSGDLLLFAQFGKSDEKTAVELGLRLTTNNANVAFAGYPEVKKISGTIDVDLQGISVQSPSFHVLLSQVRNLNLDIGVDNILRLHGEVKDNIQDLHTLAKALESDVNIDLPKNIIAYGNVAVSVDLELPLEGKLAPVFDAKVTLLDNQIQHINYKDFPIKRIKGSFHITNTGITQKKPFQARFAHRPLVFGIKNVLFEKDKILRLFANFTLPGEIINRLFALKVPLVKGASAVDVFLDLNTANTGVERLIVNSQLTGIASDIPLGIGKKAGEKVASQFVLERQNKKLFFHLNVKDRIKGTMILDEANKAYGWIGLGLAAQKPIEVSEEKLKIVATYDTIDVAPLLDWFHVNRFDEVLEQNPSQIKGTLLNSILGAEAGKNKQETELNTNILDSIEVRFVADSIGTSNFFVRNVDAVLYRTEGVWVSDMTSDMLAAKVYYASEGNVQQVIVEKLIVEKIVVSDKDQPQKKKTEDPLATFDPRISHPVSLHIKNLSYSGSDLGKWSMQLQPEADGLRLSNLEARKGKAIIKGDAFWQYLPGNDPGQQQITTANLHFSGTKIKDFLGIVDSQSGSIQTNLRWKASPIGVDVSNITGTANINFQNGFINTEEEIVALLNLIGLFNINTISQRLSLDLSDQGNNIAYSIMRGSVKVSDGLVTNVEPFIFKGPSMRMQLEGTTNLLNEEVDQTMVVQIPVGEALPLATILAGFAPQVSVVLFIASYILKKPFTQFTSARFKVRGDFEDPKIVLDRLFNVPLDEIEAELSSDTQETE